MPKYDEIMEKVEVTDAMRQRILSEIDKAGIAPAEKKTVSMRLMRRILPVAACVGILAVLAVPQIRQNLQEHKPGQEAPDVEGFYAPEEVASAEKLTDAVGFSVQDIASLKEKAEETAYMDYGDGLAEISYTWQEGEETQEIYFRKSKGQEDNSGDYNSYAVEKIVVVGKNSVTLKGESDEKISLATWSDGTFSYSLGCAKPLEKADILGIIEEIEKII